MVALFINWEPFHQIWNSFVRDLSYSGCDCSINTPEISIANRFHRQKSYLCERKFIYNLFNFAAYQYVNKIVF